MGPQSRLGQGLPAKFIDRHLRIKENIGVSSQYAVLPLETVYHLIIEIIPLMILPMLCESIIVPSA
jgi:hypothetical protein